MRKTGHVRAPATQAGRLLADGALQAFDHIRDSHWILEPSRPLTGPGKQTLPLPGGSMCLGLQGTTGTTRQTILQGTTNEYIRGCFQIAGAFGSLSNLPLPVRRAHKPSKSQPAEHGLIRSCSRHLCGFVSSNAKN